MRKLLINFSHVRAATKLLGMACVLLGAVSGGGQHQEEMTINIHVLWTTEHKKNYSQESVAGQMSDSIQIVYDGFLHAQAPPGSQPWDMNTGTMDEQLKVSGGGSGTVTGKDENGAASTYSQSWTYVLKDAAKPMGGGISMAPDGAFQVNLPSLDGVKIEAQIQTGFKPEGGLQGAITAPIIGMMLTPMGGAGMPYPSREPPFLPGEEAESSKFWSQLKGGNFDPKSRSFSKSGSGTISRELLHSTGSMPGLDETETGSIQATYSFNFNQQPEEVEAVLIPADGYDQWMPQAGDDEGTPGNGMLVKVVLQKKDKPGQKPQAKAKSFKFELIGVSKEPGVCLNWPPKDKVKKPSDFDLKIDKVGNPSLQVANDGQSATSASDLQESSVIIFSFDWGAWGSLKVSAELDNGQTVVAHLQNRPDVTELKIPKDDNNNHIADAWENQEAPPSTDAKSDEDDSPHNEQPPGDGHTGDGLSLYEEYRGFRIQGSHERTHPTQKDVFIFDRHELGRGSFGMSHLAVHLIKHEEFTYEQGDNPNPRVINFNSGYAHLGSEHVIEMLNGYAQGRLGVTEGGPNVPKNIRYVIVDKAACMASRWKEKEVDQNIAHELAHATNVQHHGEDNYYVSYAGEHYLSPKLCKGPMKGGGEVAVQGGQNSGAEECIMRYVRAAYFEWDGGGYCMQEIDEKNNPIGPFKRGEAYGPSQMPGTVFCSSNLGTGINSGRYSYNPSSRHIPNLGNATLGGCSHQFCVNDMKH